MIVTRNFSLIDIRRHIQICTQNIGHKKPVERNRLRGKANFPSRNSGEGNLPMLETGIFANSGGMKTAL